MEYPGGRGQYQEKCQIIRKLKKYGVENKVEAIINGPLQTGHW